jgi:hypothetical protein
MADYAAWRPDRSAEQPALRVSGDPRTIDIGRIVARCAGVVLACVRASDARCKELHDLLGGLGVEGEERRQHRFSLLPHHDQLAPPIFYSISYCPDFQLHLASSPAV